MPGGRKNPTAGIRLRLDGNDDLVWQAMLAQGGGRVRAALGRALDAVVEEEQFSDRHAIEIMQRAREKSQPRPLVKVSCRPA